MRRWRSCGSLHGRGLVRSVRLHDLSKQGVPFADWVYGDALSWLQEQGIPLCVPLPEVDVVQLATTLQGYPELPVVLAGVHYQHVLLVRPLMRLAAATAPGAESVRDAG